MLRGAGPTVLDDIYGVENCVGAVLIVHGGRSALVLERIASVPARLNSLTKVIWIDCHVRRIPSRMKSNLHVEVVVGLPLAKLARDLDQLVTQDERGSRPVPNIGEENPQHRFESVNDLARYSHGR